MACNGEITCKFADGNAPVAAKHLILIESGKRVPCQKSGRLRTRMVAGVEFSTGDVLPAMPPNNAICRQASSDDLADAGQHAICQCRQCCNES